MYRETGRKKEGERYNGIEGQKDKNDKARKNESDRKIENGDIIERDTFSLIGFQFEFPH